MGSWQPMTSRRQVSGLRNWVVVNLDPTFAGLRTNWEALSANSSWQKRTNRIAWSDYATTFLPLLLPNYQWFRFCCQCCWSWLWLHLKNGIISCFSFFWDQNQKDWQKANVSSAAKRKILQKIHSLYYNSMRNNSSKCNKEAFVCWVNSVNIIAPLPEGCTIVVYNAAHSGNH